MPVFPLPFKTACYRAPGAINRTVNRDIEIGLGILDHDIRFVRQGHLYVTAFIVATARAINVREVHDYFAHVMPGPAQRELQAPFGVLAQAVG
jgi:hypothetical protein